MVIVVPMLALLAVVVAWSVDGGQNGRVARNVALAGKPVGGMDQEQLTSVAAQVAAEYAAAPVKVEAPGGGFVTNAQALGLSVQVEPTVSATLALETTGSIVERIWGWGKSLFTARTAPVRVSLDRNAVYRVVASKDPGPRTPPAEPTLRAAKGGLEAVPGKPGTGIDPAHVLENLPEAAKKGLPIAVEVERREVAPRFSLHDARNLARRGEEITALPLEVKAGDQVSTVPPGTLRTWMRSEATEDRLVLKVDRAKATAAVRKLLDKPNPPPKDAAYNVVDGEVMITPGGPGVGCCADEAGGILEAGLLSSPVRPVDLPVMPIPPKVTADQLLASGIKEQVATFTTNHAAGRPRVTNIQLIADLIRGQVINPGATFSVNKFVGERTREKGFVVDGVIQDGKFEESVGGGISQFATTLFNAAFFAGLEFPEYQSHSLYISRYPYGREATLSYPKPDLQIRNQSPYPILIWPTYTRSSITVSLYSTKWVEVAQTGQSETSRGPCMLVRTERTATYLEDSTTKVDRVNALYRPEEGVNCV
ncbi:VanW family protein [soil metagenome]